MRSLFLLALFVFGVFVSAPSQATLLITPLQVVIEGRERSAKIVLVNTSNITNVYRIGWEQLVQAEGTGGYGRVESVEVEGAENKYLQNFAVFSPRQIEIAPNEKQVIRVKIRRPADLPDGEYKSHLKFYAITVPTKEAQLPRRELASDEIGLGVQVRTSYSIPVVYRVGDYDVDVAIGQPDFEVVPTSGRLKINVPVTRQGLHGIIGDIRVYFTPNNGDRVEIGSLGNANLFPEINTRVFPISTQLSGLAPGVMEVVFRKIVDDGYEIVAQNSYPISN